MPKKLITLIISLFFVTAFFDYAYAKQQKAIEPIMPSMENFQDPVITLELIDIPEFDGYWYYGANIEPTKGQAGDHGAPLPVAVTFNITNPNPYPVLLEEYKFTIAFEEFDMTTFTGYETQWIPAGKTNQLRSTKLMTVRGGLLNLLVTAGFKLQAKGTNAWAALEKWWTEISDMSFPITIHEGSFTFKADSVKKILPFKGTYPK